MTLGCVLGEIKANLHSRPSAATLQNYDLANCTGRDQGANHAPLASGRQVSEVEEVSAPMRWVGSGGGAQANFFLLSPFFPTMARSHMSRTSAASAVT